MSVGDKDDVYNRSFMNLAPWFGVGDKATFPVLYAVLQSFVSVYTFNYSQYEYVSNQMRLQTAYGNNLDLISQDYLGNSLPRYNNESDANYRARINANVLQPASTLFAMSNALFVLTGFTPYIFEQWNPGPISPDGTYVDSSNITHTTTYNPATKYTYQAFINVYLPQYVGMNTYPWYNVHTGATNFLYYNQTSNGKITIGGWYGGQSLIQENITPAQVYQVVQNTKVWGTLIWVQIFYGPPPVGPTFWVTNGGDFIIDSGGDNIVFNPGPPFP